MPRPGELTKGRARTQVKTPGGRNTVHRKKFYRAEGTCAVTGAKLQLPRGAKPGSKGSLSSKRPNRPYGGKLSSSAVRRGIISRVRDSVRE